MAETTTPRPGITPDGIYRPASYDHAMWAGDTLYVAGQVARDVHGTLMAPGDAAGQAEQVYANLGAVLDAAGVRRDQVVKVVTYLVDGSDGAVAGAARQRFFGAHRPPHTGLVVAALGGPEVRIEVEVIAHAPSG
ncbi:MAG: RidA family protein [Trueperaceae bacterium]|nr:MAG: RidA family protein [Trueperaceae bacterium]